MKQTHNFAEFWSSLFAAAQVDIFDVYLANVTNTYKVDKLKFWSIFRTKLSVS
jgi:hypothetical protein